MKAKFKDLYSIDIPEGKPELPKDPNDCWIVIHADIGTDDGTEAADTFLFYVCTTNKLSEILEQGFGRGLILVNQFSWTVIEEAITKICNSTTGKDWEEIASKLSRYGYWEFEDYQE